MKQSQIHPPWKLLHEKWIKSRNFEMGFQWWRGEVELARDASGPLLTTFTSLLRCHEFSILIIAESKNVGQSDTSSKNCHERYRRKVSFHPSGGPTSSERKFSFPCCFSTAFYYRFHRFSISQQKKCFSQKKSERKKKTHTKIINFH